jgi:predicted metal-binding membrane protein
VPGASAGETNRLDAARSISILRHARLSLLICLLLLTGATWALTLYQTIHMGDPTDAALRDNLTAGSMSGVAMSGMHAVGWSIGSAAYFMAAWTVMMAAMMLPGAAPMILLFDSVQARREGSAAVSTWIFASGYLLVWVGAGIPVYAVIETANEIALLSASTGRARWMALALGTTLLLAGFYQFTPIKRVCLHHCRSPLGFFALHWRDGRLGALRMGVLHGAYCLGCCWALFAVLVAAGVMSLVWMLLLTLIVFAEKVLPHGQRVAALVGVTLVALGLLVAVGPVAGALRF